MEKPNEQFDVIIVGASIAGLAAAKFLAGTKLSVLVLEREKEVGHKTCAHGVTRSDLKYIDDKYYNFPLDKVYLHYRGKTISAGRKGIISSIDRTKYLQDQYTKLRRALNLTFITDCSVTKIEQDQVITSRGCYSYQYLIGADGAASTVRNYLGIKSHGIGIGFQYFVPKKYDKFEVFFDDRLFGNGYAWIFPNKDWTGIGCGTMSDSSNSKYLKQNFDRWLKENNIDVAGSRFGGAIMDCDYHGYRFGNIFLVGDAAGLIGGMTGKGMYGAFASAEQVTNEILGIDKEHNHITMYLKKKRAEDVFLPIMTNGFLRRLFLGLMFTFPYFKPIRQRIAKAV